MTQSFSCGASARIIDFKTRMPVTSSGKTPVPSHTAETSGTGDFPFKTGDTVYYLDADLNWRCGIIESINLGRATRLSPHALINSNGHRQLVMLDLLHADPYPVGHGIHRGF